MSVYIYKGVQHVDTPRPVLIYMAGSQHGRVAEQGRWLHYKQTWMAFMYIPGNSKGCQKSCLVYTHSCMTAHSSQHKVI